MTVRNWRTDPAFTSASGTFVLDDGPLDNPTPDGEYPRLICGDAPTIADAYLIASAPDLLDACEMAAELFELDMAEGCTDRRGPWERLAAAIRKAKRESE